MIYTITTNPSLDYYLNVLDEPSNKFYYRSNNEVIDAGGKGVNVSIILNLLGLSSSALGFLGGFTKEPYLNKLKEYKLIQPLFTSINSSTRINVKVKGKVEGYYNAKGPSISEEEFDRFKTRLTKIYDNDIVVLSGNVQDELVDKMVSIVKELVNNSVKVILDTNEEIVDKCKEFKPFATKLNHRDSNIDDNNIINKGKELTNNGYKYVIYNSPLNKNSYLISNDRVLRSTRDKEIINTVGIGDSMVAGMVYGIIRGANEEELLKLGVITSLNAKNNNDVKTIINGYENIKVEEIK